MEWTSKASASRLCGQAFSFYRSCSRQQKSDYNSLVSELARRFTPVRIQSVQTSLFHDRKQRPNELVAQDLKTLFYKAYPEAQQNSDKVESMGRMVLTSQFVAGLLPELKTEVASSEGGFEQLLVKASFEEAKMDSSVVKTVPWCFWRISREDTRAH